ncbi:MAG TPA: 2'-5' RNA ligase family protein [Chitinophagaceae bacterium]|jgi:2'-5' RNA ligase|nr:2'-5' RNA ligase family protein [Chitinophagaceae bacterium]
MKEIVTGMPGYRVCEYKIVLHPHADLRNKISEIRKDFNKEFNVTTPVSSKVDLVLARFKQIEMMESRIGNTLNRIGLGYPPFKVELKDFGSFPSHTIFINVISKVPVQALIKQIRSETQRLMKLNDDNKPYFDMEPYIIIGRKLVHWQYEQAWLAYSNKHFTGRFIADAMLLLKRQEGERAWQIVQRFEFKNLPVNTKQGELFI